VNYFFFTAVPLELCEEDDAVLREAVEAEEPER